MNDSILTERLQLIPLDLNQLELALKDINALETSLNIIVMRPWMTDRVHRAIRMKTDKMREANSPQHD